MRSAPFPTTVLLIVSALWLAPGCASKERIQPIYPPAADLQVQPKPRLDPASLESEAALLNYDIEVEAWGEAGWQAVARLCRWAKANGMTITCPAA
jgi:hypothetical protein